MAKIERTGPQLRSKYPKSAPVPRVRSVPDPLGKVAHFILFYFAIKNFTLPPTDFKHSLYGFMKLNSNASNRAEFSDASGKPTTEARVAFAAPETLRTDIHTTDRDTGLLGPPPSDLSADAKPWRKPEGVEVPIIDTARPRAARVGGSIATLVTIPWDASGDGSEGACLAADLSVGPPVDAAIPKGSWVPHPNPDLSLRFSGPVTNEDLVAVAVCREISGGLATVETEVWQDQSLVAKGISTSLLLAKT